MAASRAARCVQEFTPAEANALVPAVKPLLARLREAFHALSFAREQWQDAEGAGEPAEAARWRAETERLSPPVQTLLDELSSMGVEVKDPLLGLVDFHGRARDGRLVLLCYRDDEDAIRFWHDTTTGFAGRRPLAEL